MNRPFSSSEPLSDATREVLETCFERTDGMLTFDECVLLYRLAREAPSGCIVEIGSYRGRSTTFLGRGSLDGARVPVYAVDPHKEFVGVLGGVFGPQDRTAFYRAMLDNGTSEIVSLINLSSECFSHAWKEPVSLLWIDGDHRYEGVKRDFECWRPHLEAGAVVAFDDATDPHLGPRMLIDELTATGWLAEIALVGKIVVLRRRHGPLDQVSPLTAAAGRAYTVSARAPVSRTRKEEIGDPRAQPKQPGIL